MTTLTIAFTIFFVGSSSLLILKTFVNFFRNLSRKKQTPTQRFVIGLRSSSEF